MEKKNLRKFKLIINFKNYLESNCENALEIAKICQSLDSFAKKKNVEIILCPQIYDLKDVAKFSKCFSQHVDDVDFGAYTGFIGLNGIKNCGGIGSLINHSEHKIDFKNIENLITRTKKLNLISCICTKDEIGVKKFSKLKPNFIAVEPPELIGGNISISDSNPNLILDSLNVIDKDVELLVGAGVKTTHDVKKAVELGAKGVLVASGVIKSKNKELEIKSLIEGFSN